MSILAVCGCDNEIGKDVPGKSVYVNKRSLNIFFGDKVQVTASPTGETFTWSSADPAIATVTSGGLVEAVGLGSTEIVVAQAGAASAKIPVTVAVPAVDKIVAAGENGRFQIALQTLSDRIASARIIWNGGNDSTDIAINRQTGVFTHTIDYSGQNGYVFKVVSIDRFGNSSEPAAVTATLLRNRDALAWAMDDGSLTVQWGDNKQYVDHCKLSYVNQNGVTVSQKVFPTEATTAVSDYSSGLSYTTLFLLLPASADTLRLATAVPSVTESTPFKGPHVLSAAVCEIAARDFDFGGEGFAFHDGDDASGGNYRANNGDSAGAAADVANDGTIGNIKAGEWLVYTVDVQEAGVYAADVLLSGGGAFTFSVDGNKSEKVVAPSNGSLRWIYETHPGLEPLRFDLTAGKHKIRFTCESEGFILKAFRFIGAAPSTTPYASWSFEDPSDLAKANGIPLELFGNVAAIEGPTPTNKAVRVEKGVDNYLKVFHGMLPAGATTLSDWTMMVVFRLPDLSGWHTIFQTSFSPTDDAEFFVRNNGQIGVGATGYAGPALQAGTWYCMIISRHNAFVSSYVNDITYHNHVNAEQARFDLQDAFLISRDNDGEDGTIDIAEIAVWKQPLTAAQRNMIIIEQQSK